MYVTRIQKERFTDPAEYEKLKGAYIVDKALLSKAKKGVVVMHPLPRVNEISTDVDDLPNAWYFRQMKHGIYARMAIIALALGVY
jgi:aspartate carbamoyltransferase catalytic subunit